MYVPFKLIFFVDVSFVDRILLKTDTNYKFREKKIREIKIQVIILRETDFTEKEIEEESFTEDPISSHHIVCFTYEINISVNDGKVNVYINFFFSISCENVYRLLTPFKFFWYEKKLYYVDVGNSF